MFNERKAPILCLKLKVPRALYDGEKIDLDGYPIKHEGETLVPKCVLELLDIESRDELVTLDGEEYVRLDSIDDICYLENEMGLIFFDTEPVTLTTKNDTPFMLELAHKFIFEVPFGKITAKDYAPATESERADFKALGLTLRELLLKRNNKHPFLFGTQDIFDKLRATYEAKDGSDLYNSLTVIVERADECFKKFPALNEAGDGLCEAMTPSGYGESEYDVGGRHSSSESVFENLVHEALAYQITGEEKYAKHAYYCSLGVLARLHWGPGHFLNCSGATAKLSMIYDWLFNGWSALGLDTAAIKDGIYRQGLHHGFNSAIHDSCDFPSPKQGTGWRFKLKPDNWNSVCNSGMILGSLIVLNDGIDEVITEEKYEKATELLGACLTSTMQPHLVMHQYAPDGSYIESNSYWAYGTVNLMNSMAALYDSLGTDLGLHHACGMDKTCYYAVYSESCEFVGWNYHDGSLSSQNTSAFNQFATISSDDTLYAIRKNQIAKGKGVSVLDMMYHPTVRCRTTPELESLPLDYAMVGIDAFTVKNGWEKGSLFAGMIGGENPTGGSHNQLDSGAFIYHNLGKMWFTDLGSDYYNSRGIKNGFGYFGNYALYRRNAEGNNCLCLTSLPYGQLLGSTGYMTEYKSSDSASYCIIDNREVYGEETVEYARRGMLLTNDRRTVVIKDEVAFKKPESAFTTAHFESDKITAEISADGRKCTLTHKDGEKIYVSLIGDGKLELMRCDEPLLSGTEPAEGEYSRENYSRLVVRYESVMSINTSFVIDTVKGSGLENLDVDMWKTL